MKVILAEHYGLCFGVRDAIAEAERLATTGPVTILGQLVHNPIVRERLRERGAEEGDLLQIASAKTSQVMITAHGAADTHRRQWHEAGFQVSDGTCPLVRKAHDALSALVSGGFFPVVIGQRSHMEVKGLIGDFPKAFVVQEKEDIAALPEAPRYGVISQTTQPSQRAEAIVEAIRAARPASEVRFTDTVCQPTKDRQTALRDLLAQVEAIVIVGGRNSNNTLQLTAKAREAGRLVYHIEWPEELRAEWFSGVSTVGITGGTSTLRETVQAVQRRLEEWSEPPRVKRRARFTASEEWIDYYAENARRQREIPWHLGTAEATQAELATIAPSLRGWQLGETSDGSHLLSSARDYARRVGDPKFVEAVQLFIREEQRHGANLGRFLDLAGIPRAKKNWGDSLFRAMRYFWVSMEVWATPVVMVETHAMIYYRALGRATHSEVLRCICAQIQTDEVPHIRFQCERLACLHRHRSRSLRWLTMGLHRLFFAGITLAVWVGHRRALRAGGYSFRRFWSSAWARMRYAWLLMAPERYWRCSKGHGESTANGID